VVKAGRFSKSRGIQKRITFAKLFSCRRNTCHGVNLGEYLLISKMLKGNSPNRAFCITGTAPLADGGNDPGFLAQRCILKLYRTVLTD
jgi:hypothetical protein